MGAALGVAMVMAVAGCGGDPVREVVVTATVTSSSATAEASTPPAATQPADVQTDVLGRAFDFGMVMKSTRVGSVDVLVLDRWTVKGLDDTTLAESGVAPHSYPLAENPYENINTRLTFRIPVREGALFLLHHCVASGEPLQSRSASAKELAAAPEADRLALIALDKAGWATGGETFAGCP